MKNVFLILFVGLSGCLFSSSDQSPSEVKDTSKDVEKNDLSTKDVGTKDTAKDIEHDIPSILICKESKCRPTQNCVDNKCICNPELCGTNEICGVEVCVCPAEFKQSNGECKTPLVIKIISQSDEIAAGSFSTNTLSDIDGQFVPFISVRSDSKIAGRAHVSASTVGGNFELRRGTDQSNVQIQTNLVAFNPEYIEVKSDTLTLDDDMPSTAMTDLDPTRTFLVFYTHVESDTTTRLPSTSVMGEITSDGKLIFSRRDNVKNVVVDWYLVTAKNQAFRVKHEKIVLNGTTNTSLNTEKRLLLWSSRTMEGTYQKGYVRCFPNDNAKLTCDRGVPGTPIDIAVQLIKFQDVEINNYLIDLEQTSHMAMADIPQKAITDMAISGQLGTAGAMPGVVDATGLGNETAHHALGAVHLEGNTIKVQRNAFLKTSAKASVQWIRWGLLPAQ